MNNLRSRIIPTFYVSGYRLINKILFNDNSERYIGDPLNTLRIFNQYNSDEIMLIDLDAWKKGINFKLLEDISNEIFCPLTYGGGVYSYDAAKKIIQLGFEKISYNQTLFNNFELIEKISDNFGSQSIVVNFDLFKNKDDYYLFDYRNKKHANVNFIEFLKDFDLSKIGEVFISIVNLDGSFEGPDFNIIKIVSQKIKKPLIYKGGISSDTDIKQCFLAGCSAVASSNFFIMKKKQGGIVFTNPNKFRVK